MTDQAQPVEQCLAHPPGGPLAHTCTKPKGHKGDHAMLTAPLPWPLWDNEDDEASR